MRGNFRNVVSDDRYLPLNQYLRHFCDFIFRSLRFLMFGNPQKKLDVPVFDWRCKSFRFVTLETG